MSQDQGITILQLGRGQRISLTATAKKGIGKEHSKWSPVSTCALKYDAVVKLNDDILDDYSEEQRRQLVESCPREVFICVFTYFLMSPVSYPYFPFFYRKLCLSCCLNFANISGLRIRRRLEPSNHQRFVSLYFLQGMYFLGRRL